MRPDLGMFVRVGWTQGGVEGYRFHRYRPVGADWPVPAGHPLGAAGRHGWTGRRCQPDLFTTPRRIWRRADWAGSSATDNVVSVFVCCMPNFGSATWAPHEIHRGIDLHGISEPERRMRR